MNAQSQAAPAPARPAAQDEFVPVSQLPAAEQIPAAPLLIAAYAVVWIIIAVYVWTLWRRFLRAEQDLKTLAARLTPPR